MEKREKIINEKRYQLLLPSVRPAMDLCTRVATLVGPAIVSLGGKADINGWKGFSESLQSVDPLKLDLLFMDAIKVSMLTCDGKLINNDNDFERHFLSNRSDVYVVCAWALWECVRDFFPELTGFIQIFKDKMAEALKSQQAGQ